MDTIASLIGWCLLGAGGVLAGCVCVTYALEQILRHVNVYRLFLHFARDVHRREALAQELAAEEAEREMGDSANG